MEAFRVFPGVANFASMYDCSIFYFSRYDIFCNFFEKFSENLNVLFSNFEIPNPIVGGVQSTKRVANLASAYDFSSFCNFRVVMLLWFFIFFFKI